MNASLASPSETSALLQSLGLFEITIRLTAGEMEQSLRQLLGRLRKTDRFAAAGGARTIELLGFLGFRWRAPYVINIQPYKT